MGASSSKARNAVTNAVSTTTTDELKNICHNELSQISTFAATDGSTQIIGGNVTIAQTAVAHIECLQDKVKRQQISNEIANAIKASSEASAGLGGLSVSDVGNIVNTSISQQVTDVQVQDCKQACTQIASILASGGSKQIVGGNVSISQTADLQTSCKQASTIDQTLTNKIANDVSAQSKASSGLDFGMFLIIGIVIIAVVYIVYSFYSTTVKSATGAIPGSSSGGSYHYGPWLSTSLMSPPQ